MNPKTIKKSLPKKEGILTKRKTKKDKELDRDLANTFPASDPITKF